ncbi:hypothetical protein GGI43DRAFT_401316 [Trichoderma evansii]
MEMKFVDVTERTTQGIRQGKRKSSKDASDPNISCSLSSSSSSSSSSSQSSITNTNTVVHRKQQQQELLPSPTFNFPIPAESVAQVFFFRHYSIAGSIRLYETQKASAMSTLKMMGIVAVGMAGLAVSKRDHNVMALARAKYGSTLLSINEAIKVREEVAKESTVAAVTLLARFEIIACQDSSTQEAWICHLQGAAVMLRQWTKDDWDKVTNPRTFLHFFYMLAMGCIIKRETIPAHILEAVQSSPLFKIDAELGPATRLFDIVYKLADLHSNNETGQVIQITEKIATALSIEKELLAWKSDLPEKWKYTLDENKFDKSYGPTCHVYLCTWQSYIWNHYRIYRHTVHSILLRYLDILVSPVTKAHPALVEACALRREASREIQSTMMRDLCASMPYILKFYDKTKANSKLFPQHSGVFGLLGSIQAMVGVAGVSEEDAGWLSVMLKYIGSRLGIGQAFVMERYLKAKS